MSFRSQCSLARTEPLLGGYFGHLRFAAVTTKPPHSACKADALPTELSARVFPATIQRRGVAECRYEKGKLTGPTPKVNWGRQQPPPIA